MKPHKLVNVNCNLCKLLIEYNKVCSHYDFSSPDKRELELDRLMNNRSLDKKEMYSSLF